MKKKLDEVYAPGVSQSTVECKYNDFNASEFKREVKRLSENEAFRRCVRNNPNKAFSEWKKMENNPKLVAAGPQKSI